MKPRRFTAVIALLLCLWSLQAQGQTLTDFRIANGTSGENPAVLWVGVDQGLSIASTVSTSRLFTCGSDRSPLRHWYPVM